MKISFGMVIKDFITLEPIKDFLENAKKYGHNIHSVIIAYQRKCDKHIVEQLRKLVDVHIIKVFDQHDYLRKELSELGISNGDLRVLLDYRGKGEEQLIPYGQNRNHVVIKGLLTGTEILFFIDSDVYPKVLYYKNNKIIEQEIDFVGGHLEYLLKDKIYVTTSDYTGYYIIPPMNFKGMKELFTGLQKNAAFEYISQSCEHNCLNVRPSYNRNAFITNKILGGNVGIKLDIFKSLIPFFSTSYTVNGKEYLSRGEDTILGSQISKANYINCIDVDLKIFHNTFGNYPNIPDILYSQNIKDRFFYTCMGWIGRNPFMNWLNGENIGNIKKVQCDNLIYGAKKISEYLNDDRFMILPEALNQSYNQLERVINEYEQFIKSWKNIIKVIYGDCYESINY